MKRIAIVDNSVPGSSSLLSVRSGAELIVHEVNGIDAVFEIAARESAAEVIAVGDGTTTLAVASGLALQESAALIRPLRRGADAWTESAKVPADRPDGGVVREVETLRVERLGCGWPIVCASVALGGVAPLLSSIHRSGSTVSAAKDFARALGKSYGTTGWRESGADTPWGLICSAGGRIGAGVSLESSETGFVATSVEPAIGGGLLGLVRGLAGILGGGTPRALTVLEVAGSGVLALDGWVTEGPDRLRISRGPVVRIVG